MMRLPFSVVAMSLEPFLQMARDADSSTYERRPSGGWAPRPSLPAPIAPSPVGAPYAPAVSNPSASVSLASVLSGSARKEDMNDNMIKVLKYWIVWTKPDEEKVFESGEKVFAYPTDVGSVSSQILLAWASDPSSGAGKLDQKDWRYLHVKTELVERYALEEKHYDRRQTYAQEKIASSLKCVCPEE
jgi:hypothetical protein